MSSKSFTMSVDEFKLFHSIDRALYAILLNELLRDPVESLQIMALWIWLERAGFRNVVVKILSLPHILINELADEALICLKCLNDAQFLMFTDGSEISLTQSFMKEEISLQFFHDHRVDAMYGIGKTANEICLRALTDIMEITLTRNSPLVHHQGPPHMMMSPSASSLGHQPFVSQTAAAGECSSHSKAPINNHHGLIIRDNRTMFVTFSKGYPVGEWEVREFFTGIFGDCIESFHMQEVRADEQALFARIVFHDAVFIDLILNGMTKAKFTINGKHVWMRKYVPKRGGCNSSSPPPLMPPRLPNSIQ